MEEYEHELAQAYETEEIARAVHNTRLAAVAASIAITAFYALDYILYPHDRIVFLLLRAAVVGLSALVYVLTFSALGKKLSRELGMIEYLIVSSVVVVMVHMTGGYESLYYAGINVVLIALLFILPLDVRRTALICGVVYAGYIVPILVRQKIEDLPTFLNNNFFLLSTMVLVILSSQLATRMRLHEFTARFRLARANEELKALDELKSQFFANVSHEVRTPLTSIISPIQSMYQGDAGEFTPPQRALIGQIYRNSLRLLDMINQMLDFSRFEARKMQLRLSPVDLGELVYEIASVFEELTDRKGLKLQYAIEGEIPTIFLDRDKIERILTNLVRNAIKFTDDGSITIRTRAEEGAVVVEVEDTGIGISQEHLPHIFERFRQVDGSSTRRYEGTGIGLAIVKEAVELLQGSVSVSSEVRQGTRFQILLPTDLEKRAPDAFVERRAQERRQKERTYAGADRRGVHRRGGDLAQVSLEDLVFIEHEQMGVDAESVSPETEVSGSTASSAPSGESPSEAGNVDRVLYVEDNADLRGYVGQMLGRMGHEVQTAWDGMDGWEKAQVWLPDVVVSDVMMPRLDGYDLIRYLKEGESTKTIPVILTTAKSELDAKIEGLRSGADDYLAKPINIRELDARIRNLVSRQRMDRAVLRAHELEERMDELSMSFAQSLEIRDSNTAGHSREVLALGTIIAGELGIPIDRVLKDSLLLHDIGKLGIPDSILRKPSPLTPEESAIMRQHAEIGAALLARFDSFREVSEIVLAHQERTDGTGYPRGLKQDQIPRYAGIIAVADAFHAMTNDRPYRRALTKQAAIAELITHKGTQFDPVIVEAFVRGMIRHGVISEWDARPGTGPSP